MYENLLKMAKEDLRAAKCLYDNELYPHTIFYLQQCVEKSAKAFAIMTNMISENEAKGQIGHNPLKIHEKLLNKQKKGLEELNKAFEKFPQLKEALLFKTIDVNEFDRGLAKSREVLDRLIENPISLSKLSKQEIMEYINDLDELESEFEESMRNIASFSTSAEEINKHKEIIIDLCNRLNLKKELETLDLGLLMEAIIAEIKKEMLFPLDFCYINLSLGYFSLFTSPHAVNTRYPDGDFNPLEFFNRDFPLIELFEKCVEKIEKTLIKIEGLMAQVQAQ